MPAKMDAIRVLIVNDNATFAAQFGELLGAQGIQPVIVTEFGAALTSVRSLLPDAILLNRWLHASDTIPLIGELRALTRAPITVLAETVPEADRIFALELGADDVVVKPASRREIVARLRAQLRRYLVFRDPAPLDSSGGWRASRKRRQVLTPAGEVVPLTAAEFDLLAALGEQPGMPLGRAVLTQRVLKRRLHDEDRSIDNLVYQVRRKLQAHGAESLVATLRNQGYASAIPLIRD